MANFPEGNLESLKRRRREFGRELPRVEDRIGRLAELLEKNGIDPAEIGKIDKVRLTEWQGFYKNAEGHAETVDMESQSIILTPIWAEGPKFPIVNAADPTVINPVSRRRPLRDVGSKYAVILPDPQIGYRQDMVTGELDPFHDVDAMNVALQIVQDVQPDLIVNIGDFLDLPSFSKYKQEPTFQRTTQAAVNTGHTWLGEQRSNAPDAEIILFQGNHDIRLEDQIMNHLAAAYGLQRANLPEEWPVLSVPYLLRLEELGVQYIDGYPANSYWVNDRLVCIHGSKVRSTGSTAAAEVDDERVSVIFGHIHRIEQHFKTRNVRGGVRINSATSPGCLSRIDGAVPSTKGGTDSFGRPLKRYENWQQGIAVVQYDEGDSPFSIELVPIFSGTATWRGEHYVAEAQ